MIEQGFILSRRTITQQNVSCIELWVATDRGAIKLITEPQESVCFILASDRNGVKHYLQQQFTDIAIEHTQLTTLEYVPVCSLKANNENRFHEVKRRLQDAGVSLFEADIKLTERFLMERFIYGSIAFKSDPETKPTTIHNAKVKPCDYLPSLSHVSIDIECDEQENLYSIAIAAQHVEQVFLIGEAMQSEADVPIHWCADERALLQAFENAIRTIDPDIIIGWNVKNFDCNVLSRRAKKLGIGLKLGRQQQVMSVRQWDLNQSWVDIPGRAVIDGIDALKTMTFHYSSFSLDHVAHDLLGKGKLIDEPDKLNAIKTLYQTDKVALAKYNLEDCRLVNQIAEKTQFIDFLVLRAKLTGLELGRPGGSVAAFLNVYLPKLHRAGYVSPNRPGDGGLASPGGYVMSSKPGLYKHVLVLDFKSLYPSIIRTFLIDPVGLAEGLKHPQSAVPGFKGAVFSRTNHFLPDIITSLWQQRDVAKQQQDLPRSSAIKILMNSFYGVLGSGGCPLYDPRLASSITMRGHEIMQTTASWIKALGYDVIYGDTDSTFVSLPDVNSTQEAQQIGKQLEATINARWTSLLREEFQLESHLEIEFETLYAPFFMPTIRGSELGSKKRYAGFAVNQTPAKLVFKGLENVRSDWTDLAKQFQHTLYEKVFTNEPVEHFINQTISDLRKGKWDKALVYSRRLRKPVEQYVKTMPPHVKAAHHARNLGVALALNNDGKGMIQYVMTTQGPQTLEAMQHPFDYEHYIDKQLRPIADSILPHIGLSFGRVDQAQLSLFDE